MHDPHSFSIFALFFNKDYSMINITFPDGSVRQFEQGVSGYEIARSLSNSLAREVLSINVNEELWDLNRPKCSR